MCISSCQVLFNSELGHSQDLKNGASRLYSLVPATMNGCTMTL